MACCHAAHATCLVSVCCSFVFDDMTHAALLAASCFVGFPLAHMQHMHTFLAAHCSTASPLHFWLTYTCCSTHMQLTLAAGSSHSLHGWHMPCLHMPLRQAMAYSLLISILSMIVHACLPLWIGPPWLFSSLISFSCSYPTLPATCPYLPFCRSSFYVCVDMAFCMAGCALRGVSLCLSASHLPFTFPAGIATAPAA